MPLSEKLLFDSLPFSYSVVCDPMEHLDDAPLHTLQYRHHRRESLCAVVGITSWTSHLVFMEQNY